MRPTVTRKVDARWPQALPGPGIQVQGIEGELEALLLSLQDRGVRVAKLAVGDGGLGLWSTLAEVHPETRAPRCRVHKTANVLDRLTGRVQGEAKTITCNLKLRKCRRKARLIQP